MTPCPICGREGLKAFASNVCVGNEGDKNREECIDGGRARLGMNPNWHRLRHLYPWMAKKKEKPA